VRGKKMSRVIVTKYGSRQVFYVIDPHLGWMFPIIITVTYCFWHLVFD
jgi:hypothetical protein